ncbi:MAG: hypothetical protein ACJ0DH_03825 [bacterium]
MKQNIKGMLSLEELEELVKREEIDTVLMVFTDLYGRFMGKRYDAEFFSGRRCRTRNPCL